MPTGMDMLVGSVLKAAGVDPDKVRSDLSAYGKQLQDRIASLDASLIALKVDQALVHEAVRGVAEQLIIMTEHIAELRGVAVPAVNGESKHAG